jgi:hypothetical protein
MKISELPPDIKKLALLRQQECLSLNHDKGADQLCLAFEWGSTIESYDFWEHWNEKEVETIQLKTDKEEITEIIQKKIDIMEMRKFPNYNLAIGILKDLIREIK